MKLQSQQLRIGGWRLDPASCEISRGENRLRLDARTARLLQCLAERAGEVVSIEELLNEVWPGVSVTQDSVYQAVATLRRQLGDDPKSPTYIATVPRLGYRMVATVSLWTEKNVTDAELSTAPARNKGKTGAKKRSARFWLELGAVATALALSAVLAVRSYYSHSQVTAVSAPGGAKGIAVLPFLDLTEGMKNEEFADGMTEELIDKLSKVQGLQVAPPTSSFYYKEKQAPIGEVAKALHVNYVLDGSIRKSGNRLRDLVGEL